MEKKLSDLTFSTGAQSKAKPTLRTTDEAETTENDSVEEKKDDDAKIAPVVEEDRAQLDEEPEVKQLESHAATEACGNGTIEDVIESLDDKPEKKSTDVSDDSRLGPGTLKIGIASPQSIRFLGEKRSKRL